jgi:hypothetical protein
VIAAKNLLLSPFPVIDDKGGEEHGLNLVLDDQFLPLAYLFQTDRSDRFIGRSDRSVVSF